MSARLRLDAYLQSCGLGSRQDVRRILRAGRVTVGGEACRDHGRQIDAAAAVTLDGEPVVPLPAEAHVVLHKPAGCACSHDEREAPLVYDLLPARYAHLALEACGRLDRDTTGLLLFTSDGQLLHRLIHPGRKVPKRYRVTYLGRLSGEAVARCRAGIRVPDEERPYLPAELLLHEHDEQGGTCTLILHEGRYHQVKRMIHALGGAVVALHRDRIGELDLPADLGPGVCRDLTADELAAVQRVPDDGDGV